MVKIAGMSVGALVVGAFVILALLGMMPGATGLFGLSWFVWALLVGALYAVGVGLAFRGASAGNRRLLKFGAIGAAGFMLLTAFVLPGFSLVPPTGDGDGAPQAQLSIAEGTVFNFPDFSTDGDGATGVSEIAINSEDLLVILQVVADSGDDTLAPDSFAIDFTLACVGFCSYVDQGALRETPYHARVVGMSDWFISGNESDVKIVERGPSDNQLQVAWTDIASNTIVGHEDGGAMGLLEDGESGTFTLSVYLNEDGLPSSIPINQVYTRSAVVEVFSPRGGTSFTVTVNLELTVNDEA